jgi:oligoendopeptidase F
MFRRYFHAKAKKLGKEKLAWWDLNAPLGKSDKVYSGRPGIHPDNFEVRP